MNVVDLVERTDNGDWPEVPPVTDRQQLIDTHRQLLVAAAERGHEYVDAAHLVGRLALEIPECTTSPVNTAVSMTFTQIIDALRKQPATFTENEARFDLAREWLRHVALQVELAKTEPAEAARSVPTLQQARAQLDQVLTELQNAGRTEVGLQDVPKSFLTRVRSRPWVSAEMSRLAQAGRLIGTGQAGIYRFPPRSQETAGITDLAATT